jgi:hypothetical protein
MRHIIARLQSRRIASSPAQLAASRRNCNAHAERFVRSVKGECLNRLVIVGEAHLCRPLVAFIEHYHRERNHQGFRSIMSEPTLPQHSGANLRKPRPRTQTDPQGWPRLNVTSDVQLKLLIQPRPDMRTGKGTHVSRMPFGSTYVLLEANHVMEGTAKQAKESGSASVASRRILRCAATISPASSCRRCGQEGTVFGIRSGAGERQQYAAKSMELIQSPSISLVLGFVLHSVVTCGRPPHDPV